MAYGGCVGAKRHLRGEGWEVWGGWELGDLKKNIEYIIGMERQSGNIDTPTPQDIARILNVPVEEVRQCMKEMGL